jgi:hypothetical protein
VGFTPDLRQRRPGVAHVLTGVGTFGGVREECLEVAPGYDATDSGGSQRIAAPRIRRVRKSNE